MRLALLWNVRLLIERLAVASARRRRMTRLRGTAAAGLKLGHIDSLELLDICKPLGVSVIYDIGASIGTWSQLALSQFPSATIEAFEPLLAHFEALQARLHAFPNVSLHRIALGAENAEKALYVTDFSDASSLLKITPNSVVEFDLHEDRAETIRQQRLDDYAQRNGLGPPDLIKLDVQGYELEVFRGAESALSRARAIIIEVSFVEYYFGQCLFHDVVSYLADRGFRVAAFGASTPVGRKLSQTDALFLRAS